MRMPAAGVCAPASKFTTERAKPPVTGRPAGEGSRDVPGSQRHQLLVRVEALPPLGRERAADRDRLDETHHADQQCGHRQLAPQGGVEGWPGERRQSCRDGAHDLHALRVPAQRPGESRGHRDGGHRSSLGQHVRRARPQAPGDQQGLESLAHPEQERGRCCADGEGQPVRLVQVAGQGWQSAGAGCRPGRGCPAAS